MAETYTSGLWRVKAGHDEEFVTAWTAFVAWAATQPGSGGVIAIKGGERES